MASRICLLVLLVCMFSVLQIVVAQNCGCALNQCCSRWGYCGTTAAYCGTGCQQGPCYSKSPGSTSASVASIVTPAFFNGIISQAGRGCEGKTFYTRSAFLTAAGSYPAFGTTGSIAVRRQEIAAFFAHVTRETGHFCYIREIRRGRYCANSAQNPCVAGQNYYGRGPLQITWNYNYGPAGRAIGFNGLRSPDTVASDPVIAFKTAFWFWMTNVHSKIVSGRGFGSTIRAINGGECDGGKRVAVNERVSYFTKYCRQLNVSPGTNLYC